MITINVLYFMSLISVRWTYKDGVSDLKSAVTPPTLNAYNASFLYKPLIFDVIMGLHKQISVPTKLSQSMINLVFIPRQPFKQHKRPLATKQGTV